MKETLKTFSSLGWMEDAYNPSIQMAQAERSPKNRIILESSITSLLRKFPPQALEVTNIPLFLKFIFIFFASQTFPGSGSPHHRDLPSIPFLFSSEMGEGNVEMLGSAKILVLITALLMIQKSWEEPRSLKEEASKLGYSCYGMQH